VDSTCVATFAGIGFAVVVAQSVIFNPIRRIVSACYDVLFRTGQEGTSEGMSFYKRYKKIPAKIEWCLYCTAFWLGFPMHFISPVASTWYVEMLYYAGICWVAVQIANYLNAFKMN
jgi:hypothetical protein